MEASKFYYLPFVQAQRQMDNISTTNRPDVLNILSF